MQSGDVPHHLHVASSSLSSRFTAMTWRLLNFTRETQSSAEQFYDLTSSEKGNTHRHKSFFYCDVAKIRRRMKRSHHTIWNEILQRVFQSRTTPLWRRWLRRRKVLPYYHLSAAVKISRFWNIVLSSDLIFWALSASILRTLIIFWRWPNIITRANHKRTMQQS